MALLDSSLHYGLGQQFRQWRKQRKLRQADTAVNAGLSLPTVRLLEREGGLIRSLVRVLDVHELKVTGRTLPQGEHLGQQLLLLRKRKGINQRTFAAMLDVCQDTVIALERDNQGNLQTLNKALLVLGVKPCLVHRAEAVSFYTHAGNSSGQNEWATPAWVIDALMAVLGKFDLDPCGDSRKPVTRARVVFTADDDGLHLPWMGNTFVNPPYGRELGLWVDKMVAEVEAGRVLTLTALVPARTDTNWWHRAMSAGASVLFLKGRLKFGNSDQSAPFPSALLLWGLSPELLAAMRRAFPGAIAFKGVEA
ncbi:hypothetical protein SD80_012495 [Scytonema tolypothrichoides VB-61278]|nr:hypothetical protein SD80_012495 [Scytonema tolypothrichoides VB-61278]